MIAFAKRNGGHMAWNLFGEIAIVPENVDA
jgi:hypothetical protein